MSIKRRNFFASSIYFDQKGRISRKEFLRLTFLGLSSSAITACTKNQLGDSQNAVTTEQPLIVSTEVIQITPSPQATLAPTPTPTITPAPTPTVNLEATRLAITTRDLLRANLAEVREVPGYAALAQFPDEVNLSTEDRLLLSKAEMALLEAYVKTEDCFGVVANGPSGPRWAIFSIPTTTLRAYRPFYILTSRGIGSSTTDATFNSIKVDALQNLADMTDSQITLNFHPSFADEDNGLAFVESEPRFILNIGQRTLASINELTIEKTGALANSQIDNQPTVVVFTSEGEEILHTATETANNAPSSLTFMHGMTGRIYKAAPTSENPFMPDLLSPQLQLLQDDENLFFWRPTTVSPMEHRLTTISEINEGRQNVNTGIGLVNGLEIPISFSFETNGPQVDSLLRGLLIEVKQEWFDIAATALFDSSRARHNIQEGTRYSFEEFVELVKQDYGKTKTLHLKDGNAQETMFDPRNGYIVNFVSNPNLPIVQSTSHNGTPLGFTLPRLDIHLTNPNSPLTIIVSQSWLVDSLNNIINHVAFKPEYNLLVRLALSLGDAIRDLARYLSAAEMEGLLDPKGIDLASFITSQAAENKIRDYADNNLRIFEIDELFAMQIGPEDDHPFDISISKQ